MSGRPWLPVITVLMLCRYYAVNLPVQLRLPPESIYTLANLLTMQMLSWL